MITNRLKSFVRSVFPFVESYALSLVARYGFHVSPTVATAVLGFGGLGISAAVHWLESHFPWVGVFLGWIGAPTYAPALKTLLASQLNQAQSEIQALQTELNAWKTSIPATGAAVLTANGAANS